MLRQSQPSVLLTRPLAASQRFAQGLTGNVVISPLMQPEFLTPKVPAQDFAAVVFTSETGVEAATRLAIPPTRAAYCVGNRTAQAAARAGWQTISADGDVAALAALILAQNPRGPVLIIRPEDSAGNLHETLKNAGLEPVSITAYRQNPMPLSQDATHLLHQTDPVLLPLFSPRSAQLFGLEYHRINATAPLLIAAISPAVIAVLDFPVQDSQVATRPDAAAMRQVLVELTQRGLGA